MTVGKMRDFIREEYGVLDYFEIYAVLNGTEAVGLRR